MKHETACKVLMAEMNRLEELIEIKHQYSYKKTSFLEINVGGKEYDPVVLKEIEELNERVALIDNTIAYLQDS